MRILLDTTYAARAPYSGTAVYLARLQQALGELGAVEVVPARNRRRGMPAGGGIGSARNAAIDLWWVTAELPRLARRSGAELIHHPLPAVSVRAGVPEVITVHDLAFERLPDAFDRRFRTYARRMHRTAARRAAAVICVSEATAADVRERWGVARARLVVAPHGPGQELPRTEREESIAWLMYVGDSEPRKNLGVLLAAYARYRETASERLELVLVGDLDPSLEREPGVRVERHASPARLSELYGRAAALVHPSLYEGFGLTVLEAMSAGTPVIAAEAPGVSEVCGGAALYADPHDPLSFAAAIGAVVTDAELRGRLSARGRERAEEFSWSASARAHLDAYSLAVAA
jgi:glycosyltransferase involved in cell wall biosynthesis